MAASHGTGGSLLGKLPLTALEAKIFRTLLSVVDEEGLGTTLRVAGGWVRDKLLPMVQGDGGGPVVGLVEGHPDNVDIDIALDDMLGMEFAERVNAWLAKNSEVHRGIGKIARNPDQSKHLETATLQIHNTWVDMVNLRTEKYSHDSRIPDIAIGTPEEDARRRDLTINSLFYNINTEVVEDFTGMGIADLKQRIVRTPLPPLTTLLDDPLRALRSIRFASRFNFEFDTELCVACASPSVHQALASKISRERIGSEVQQMLTCRNPIHAMGLIAEFGMFHTVFALPKAERQHGLVACPDEMPQTSVGILVNSEILRCRKLVFSSDPSPHTVYLGRLAALLAPLAACRYSGKRKSRPIPVTDFVCDELRFRTKDTSLVSKIHGAALSFMQLVKRSTPPHDDRLSVGLVVRSIGPLWEQALSLALAMEMPPKRVRSEFKFGFCNATNLEEVSVPAFDETDVLVRTYRDFAARVDAMELGVVWELKPLINGKDILSVLPGLPRGPSIGLVMDKQVEWQIANPKGTVEECRLYLLHDFSHYAGKATAAVRSGR